VLQALEDLPAEMIVLPESDDPLARVKRLNVVGVDAPLLPERRLPAHGPRKQRRIAEMIVSGSDKQLRDLPFIEVFANGKIARRSEGAEHQQHLVFLDKVARQVQRGSRVGFVVVGNETHLAAVDSAALVDQLEIR